MDKIPEPRVTYRQGGSKPTTEIGTGWLTPEEYYRLGEATTELDDMHAVVINRKIAAEERKKVFERMNVMADIIEIGGDQ